MGNREFSAGVASGDITPTPGIHMGGYWGRKSGATDVHDPLAAKVMTFALGGTRAALVALDLVGLDADAARDIRARVQEETGIPAAGVMVCCSHTHAGPLTASFRGMGEVDLEYLERVKKTVVALAGQAAAHMQPVRMAYARVPVQIGINRREARKGGTVIGRNPQGLTAPYAHGVRFDGQDGTLAILFSHACHGVVLGSANHSISADFAGEAARYLEAETGAPALFVNGACGDINPRRTGGSFADVEQLGRELGEAVARGLGEAVPLAAEAIGYLSDRMPLPLSEPRPRLLAEADKLVLQLKAEIGKIAAGGGDIWAQRVPRARLAWAREMLELTRSGKGEDRHQSFEIQVIALGELGLIGLEGEIFVRYQLDLEEESPLPATILCGYANGCIGYVPTADEYARGGYEIEEAYKVYPGVQMIAPESEQLIRQKVRAMLASLAGCGQNRA